MSTQEVKDMFDWINSVDLYSGTPNIHSLGLIESLVFERPETADSPNPYVITREIKYNTGMDSSSLPFWKQELLASQSENGTLIYDVFQDSSDVNTLQTLEVYKSLSYSKDVHSKGEAAMENQANIEKSTARSIQTVLKQKGGFLYKAV